MQEQEENKIEKFIKDNNLDFTGSGSSLNGQCVILAGYACYLGINSDTELGDKIDEFDKDFNIISRDAWDELSRVFNYAYDNNYGEFWKTEQAKKMYKF